MKSWVSVSADSHFPLQNLPYGIFSTAKDARLRPGVAIGEYVLDLKGASKLEPLAKTKAASTGAFDQESLNLFMSLGKAAWREVRMAVTQLLSADQPILRDNAPLRSQILVPQNEATMHLPACIGDYTDFYACMEHAKNGTAIRTGMRIVAPNWGQALVPPQTGNFLWKYLHSWWSMAAPKPVAKKSGGMDFELEMACLVGTGNKLGEAIPVDGAADHIFGLVLMNDWSARDFQRWEMLPLGPFNSKNFATSISPWVVPLDALQPFSRAAPLQKPEVLPYLQQQQRSLYDIQLQATLLAAGETQPTTITRTNFQQLYWSLQQMVAHHTYGGCNLRPGDLLGTGTISSPGPGGQGSLLELSWGGSKEVMLDSGATRRYLEDGDTITLSGYCQGDGYRVGFGECKGTILPAPQQ